MTTTSPIIFFPGTLCDERIWLPLWKLMPHINRRYVPLQWANNLADMLALTNDRVLPDEKVHLVGYSMGGFVASRWAADNSDKVASITLIGYDAEGLNDEEIKQRKAIIKQLKHGQFNLSNKQYLARFVMPNELDNPNVAGVIADMNKDLGKGTLVSHIEATTPRPSMINELKGVKTPLTVIGGAYDQIAPPDALRRTYAKIPNTSVHILEDASHMMLLEHPDLIAKLLERL